jgi:co-chaperonin GroES (HSP10)
MELTVIGPRAFVRPDALPEMNSEGTLHIVRDRSQSTMTGTVVALGDGPRSRSGLVLEHIVSVDDRVIFSPDKGEELIFEKDVLISLLEDDILAVIE